MKLLFCNNCHDIFSLSFKEKTCTCGKVKGKYIDQLNAEYSGDDAIPLGIANPSFAEALENQPESGWGEEFTAWVIAKKCDTMVKK